MLIEKVFSKARSSAETDDIKLRGGLEVVEASLQISESLRKDNETLRKRLQYLEGVIEELRDEATIAWRDAETPRERKRDSEIHEGA